MALQIVLVEPEIPPNTGNISRLCAATGAVLHLIEPLGFSIEDRKLKRAGLDYWHLLDLRVHRSWQNFVESTSAQHSHPIISEQRYYLTTKSGKAYSDVRFRDGDMLIFGSETRGLSAEILQLEPEHNLRIPILSDARSLNLSNAVAVVLYEALRQLNYPGLTPSAICDRQ